MSCIRCGGEANEKKFVDLRYLTLSSEGGFVVPLNFAAQPLGPKTILPAIEALVARLA